jgi:hypothetical protein
MWRASQELIADEVLIADVNLMTTPTKERLAEKLARTIHDDIASLLYRAKERLQVFRGLRITPVVTVDPDDGSLGFSFEAGRRAEDVDATLERLLELPGQLAAERIGRSRCSRRVPEIVTTRICRSSCAHLPGAAGGGAALLGSKRHMMERIFNDENEPFWQREADGADDRRRCFVPCPGELRDQQNDRPGCLDRLPT